MSQQTGFKDCNENNIKEGDFLRFSGDKYFFFGTVIKDNDDWTVLRTTRIPDSKLFSIQKTKLETVTCEILNLGCQIIGNIKEPKIKWIVQKKLGGL